MTPPIPLILESCARVHKTTAAKIVCMSLFTERIVAARTLSMYLCANIGYTVRQICASTNIPEIDVRTAITAGRRKAASSSKFRDTANLVRDILDIPYPSKSFKEQESPQPRPFWTEEDLRRIHQACLDAAVFMQHFGQGEDTRTPIVNGYGYYTKK